MNTMTHDDCWPPRSGSWEEAVDPYDIQTSRPVAAAKKADARELPIEALADPRPQYNMPATR